jgi:hypothetical protein
VGCVFPYYIHITYFGNIYYIPITSYLRYPPKRDRLYTVGPEPKGRLAGREHIADVAVGVWEEDEGVD